MTPKSHQQASQNRFEKTSKKMRKMVPQIIRQGTAQRATFGHVVVASLQGAELRATVRATSASRHPPGSRRHAISAGLPPRTPPSIKPKLQIT